MKIKKLAIIKLNKNKSKEYFYNSRRALLYLNKLLFILKYLNYRDYLINIKNNYYYIIQ